MNSPTSPQAIVQQKYAMVKAYQKALKEKDFKAFASFCSVRSGRTKENIYFHGDTWNQAQKQFIRSRTGKDIILKPRQIGFTTMELIRDIFYALSNPGSTVMIVGQNEATPKQLLSTIKEILSRLDDMGKNLGTQLVPERKSDNVKEISFSNNSKIIVEASKKSDHGATSTGRGLTIDRLHCTEVAFWFLANETMTSLMNASEYADEIVIESTANGATGYFYEFYNRVKNNEAGSKWKHHFYPWYEQNEYKEKFSGPIEKNAYDATPRDSYEETLINDHKISKEQLRWWRQKISSSAKGIVEVLQEYPIDEASCFRLKQDTFLDQEDFEYLEKSYIQPQIKRPFNIHPKEELLIWQAPTEHKKYIIGADTAYGRGDNHDSSCFYVIEKESGHICARYSSNSVSPELFGKMIHEAAKFFNDAFVVIEVLASGSEVISTVLNQGYRKLYKHSDKDYYGFNTTSNRRTEMFNMIQRFVKQQDPPIIDYEMVKEFRSLILKDNTKIEHIKGSHDDHILAFMLAQKIREELPKFNNTGYISVATSRLGKINGYSLRGLTNHHGGKMRHI